MKRILAASSALLAAGCASDDLEMWANGLSMAAAEMEAEANYCPPGTYRYQPPPAPAYAPAYPATTYGSTYPYSYSGVQPASWCAPIVTGYSDHDDDRHDRHRGDRDYRDGYRDGYEDGRDDRRDDRRRHDRD